MKQINLPFFITSQTLRHYWKLLSNLTKLEFMDTQKTQGWLSKNLYAFFRFHQLRKPTQIILKVFINIAKLQLNHLLIRSYKNNSYLVIQLSRYISIETQRPKRTFVFLSVPVAIVKLKIKWTHKLQLNWLCNFMARHAYPARLTLKSYWQPNQTEVHRWKQTFRYNSI